MSKIESVNCTNEAFSCKTKDSLAILRLGRDALKITTDLGLKDDLMNLLSKIEKAPDLKALLVINSSDFAGCFAYREFLKKVTDKNMNGGVDLNCLPAREENALSQLAIRAASFGKLIIAALQGDITTSFLGVSLAYDFRFATKDLRIISPYTEVGAPQVGAFGFYLPRYIGQAKATELLFSDKVIDAKEALELGIVNEIFDTDNFELSVLDRCETLCHQPTIAIEGTRKLIHNEVTELEQYMLCSREIMTQWVDNMKRKNLVKQNNL